MSNEFESYGDFLLANGGTTTKAHGKDGKWVYGKFNPKGTTWKDRYGFTLEETNGSPVGEAAPTEDFYDALYDNQSNPFGVKPSNRKPGEFDISDCRYVMASKAISAWAKIVLPLLDSLIPTTKPPVKPCEPVIVEVPAKVVIPDDVRTTANLMTSWSVIGPGRAARLVRMRDWIGSL